MRPPEGQPPGSKRQQLERLPGRYAVGRLDPGEPIPEWASPERAGPSPAPVTPDHRNSPYLFNVTRTDRELSIVIEESLVPPEPPGTKIERGFVALRIAGTLEFSQVGIIAMLTAALAAAEIPVFVISTFETDYVLVNSDDEHAAINALQRAGVAMQQADP